mgnify:CR=1 FL=1
MIRLANIFGDSMVLQRGKPLPVWGQAAPGAGVTVSIQGRKAAAAADATGCWRAELPPLEASFAETLTVACGGETLTLRDVQVGEVWLAGGQSNMEFQMRYDLQYAEEQPLCADDALRFYDVPEISYPGQDAEADYSLYGVWRKAQPQQLERFSAVGYWFAKQLRRRLHVPVGVVGCNWGGTPVCAWMSRDAIRAGGGQVLLDEYAAAVQGVDGPAYDRAYRADPGSYRTDLLADLQNDLIMYSKPLPVVQAELAARGLAYQWNPLPIGPKYERRPSGLYEAMLKPLAPFAVRGILWYQGETDGDGHPELYAGLFPALIADWRALWGEQLPFLFVQLAPLEAWMQCTGAGYPTIRAAQQHTAHTVPGTGMAVITDAGMRWDIHPKAKRPVGERLALLARKLAYGEAVQCEAPTLAAATIAPGLLCLRFQNAGAGLSLADTTPYGERLPAGRLCGVTVLQGGRRVDAAALEARIAGDCVWLSGPELQQIPTRVEVACSGWYQVNLYNSAGLPARPAAVGAAPAAGR